MTAVTVCTSYIKTRGGQKLPYFCCLPSDIIVSLCKYVMASQHIFISHSVIIKGSEKGMFCQQQNIIIEISNTVRNCLTIDGRVNMRRGH